MKILMVSTSYPSDRSDWRGVFIRHLVYALSRRPEVSLQLWAPPGQVPPQVHSMATPEERQWLLDLAAAGGIAHLIRSRGLRSITAPLALMRKLRGAYRRGNADVYHVNWLQNALALPNDGTPLLVSVLGTDMQLLRLPTMRHFLRRAFRNRQVAICPNAEWMVPELARAFGAVADVRFVPFGIDPAWFEIERARPRPDTRRWLCVTRVTRGKLGHLIDWGERVFQEHGRELHLFGPMQEQIALPGWIHYHGPASADELCREWFPRAQGLITLSQHAEGRPQVMLEAMAAALPIIASAIPAHSDMVTHGSNGLLCHSAGEVMQALDTLDHVDTNIEMGIRGRQWVASAIGTWEDCAGRYTSLYHHLLGRRSA